MRQSCWSESPHGLQTEAEWTLGFRVLEKRNEQHHYIVGLIVIILAVLAFFGLR